MIRAVYIIKTESGLCIVTREYMDIGQNPYLLSSFLLALLEFGQEMSSGNTIETVDFGEYDICISCGDGVIVASIIDKTDCEERSMCAMDEIRAEFMAAYGSVISNWSGDMAIFAGFDESVDRITMNGTVSVQSVRTPVLRCKVSPMSMRIGQMSKNMYDVAVLCTGALTIEDIALRCGLDIRETQSLLVALENMDIIEWTET